MISDLSTLSPDFTAVKSRQQAAWSTGNYSVVGTTLQIVGENLCEALDLAAGARVLDVAAGNGNATLAAARRYADVTSTDYVPALLEDGRRRAQAEGLSVRFEEADAENLPYADSSFDAVLSTFGVMFTPDQERAAAEMLRVVKPGGRIGLANWTPDGFIGQLFRLIGRYVPPAPGIQPPSAWGSRARLEELFPAEAAELRSAERQFVFRYRSPLHFIEVFRTFYGPVNRTFAALDPEREVAFTTDLLQMLEGANRSGGHTLIVPSTYLEVVVEKRA